MGEPFIKLYKKMLKWEWYDDANTKILFLHCLLKANWENTRWHGVELEPGQFITSLATLAKETKLSVRQVRVALDHLILTGEVTSKGQSKYRVITVNNWSCYQGNDKQRDKQVTSKRQASDKQVTTVKEIKERKERKEEKEYKYYPHDEILNKAFTDYVDHRKRLKKPMSDRAIELAIEKLDKMTGGNNDLAVEIINQSIREGWQGLFELKDSPKQNNVYDAWAKA